MKIIVYAISKNEEQFVDRWVDSMQEADQIYVLDTGSIDNTVNKLKSRNVIVKKEIINPWRFDVARNKSLELVPDAADICVCTDLDEVFVKGWRKELEKTLLENPTRVSYNYNWSLDKNNKPIVNFYISKIHKKDMYRWEHPVHEVLVNISEKEDKEIVNENITLNHYPDSNKSRSSYLPLLELSVKEDPEDDRNMHYLGREYMYYQEWNKCIDTLIRHLDLKKATWKDERSASMRFIAKSYENLNRYEEARMWLDKAINEAPYLRDPYVQRGVLEYNLKNYQESINYLEKALEIKDKYKSYINDPNSWNDTIYDILSLDYYYIGNKEKAISNIDIAISLNDDERLKKNKEIFLKLK